MLNEKIRDRDWQNKVSQKVYADAKRSPKDNDIVPCDQMLLKNTKVRGKLARNFESEQYTVNAKEACAGSVRRKYLNHFLYVLPLI